MLTIPAILINCATGIERSIHHSDRTELEQLNHCVEASVALVESAHGRFDIMF
ncbi:hypothetical protein AUR04nite_35180 [Glutamicibacter uratoxydans]|uniref:Uncharacterized protein n=1 Tax=Glutamicibacter uratoxydans TaxID=43667 RepID=A0A4Y4DST5_GLUUR|nr:hypothetical protein AUR04nite_35180 [Glutamicibacter uratoxydans]